MGSSAGNFLRPIHEPVYDKRAVFRAGVVLSLRRSRWQCGSRLLLLAVCKMGGKQPVCAAHLRVSDEVSGKRTIIANRMPNEFHVKISQPPRASENNSSNQRKLRLPGSKIRQLKASKLPGLPGRFLNRRRVWIVSVVDHRSSVTRRLTPASLAIR